MHRGFIMISLLFYAFVAKAQNDFFIDVDLLRYSQNPALFQPSYYNYKLSFINGVKLGYKFSDQFNQYLGFRRTPSKVDHPTGYTYEKSEAKGFELTIGVEYFPKKNKKFRIGFFLELIREIASYKGTYWVDYPPTYTIDHIRNFTGVGSGVKLNYRLIERVELIATVRYKYGYVRTKGIESLNPEEPTLFDNAMKISQVEGLNSAGIRFSF